MEGKWKILGTEFTVVMQKPDLDAVGISNDCRRMIKIDPGLPYDTQVETFYHEVVHMILRLSGLSSVLEDKVDEAVAQCIGYGLHRFIAENDGLPHVSLPAKEEG